jgi:CheY-like chemotaxis protein
VVTEMGVDDALERLGSSRFDCVVSTYRFPDGNGLEFLRSVREDHPRLPFVLVTDEGSEAVASEAIEAGVTDYLDALLDEPAPFVERVTDTVAEYRGARDAAECLQVHEAIVETVPILLRTADESATVTGVRGRASDDVGTDPDAAVGRAVSDLFDGNPAVVDGYETALDGGETAAEVEIGERAFRAWVQPLGAATDDTSGAVLLAVDITGRRDREAELEKRNERLKRVASVISHDLRGPLQIT